MSIPFDINGDKLTLECEKPRKEKISFLINTMGEGYSNTIVIPAENDRLFELEFRLEQLERQLVMSSPEHVILAIAQSDCPEGWVDYTPAYGRFIRGIDKTNKKVDPDLLRTPGSLQEDMIKIHTHTYTAGARHDVSGKGSTSNFAWNGAGYTTGKNKYGGPETRPKNVALLYCRKQ